MLIDRVVYYYVTNLQGDVLGLIDSSGTTVASYTYDPFGKVLSATGSIAEKNPLRYRGYYYDSESGLYYLQSRYYDPNTCRFVNADIIVPSGASADLISYNLFAYCGNNPTNNLDLFGHMPVSIPVPPDLLAVVIVIVVLYVVVSTLIELAPNYIYNISSTYSNDDSVPQSIAQTIEDQQYNYWQAYLLNRKLVIGEPLNYLEACQHVSEGGSVMCRNQAAAMAIIITNRYRGFVGPEIHGDYGEYYYHFHPTRNHTGHESIHIWFYN